MIRFLLTTFLMVFVFVIVLIAIPFFIPAESYKPLIVQSVKKHSGKELAINGPMQLSLLPNPSIKIADVTLSDPTTPHEEPFISLSALSLGVKLWPLLSKKLEVDNFILINPTLRWDTANPPFGQKAAVITGEESADAPITVPAVKPASKTFIPLYVGDVRIVNGTAHITHQRKTHSITNANITFQLPDPTDTARAEGYASINGNKLNLRIQLTTPETLFKNQETDLQATLSSDSATVEYTGNIQNRDTLQAKGHIKGNIPSITRFATWLGQPLPSSPFTRAKLQGNLEADNTGASLSNLTLQLDDATFRGNLAADLLQTPPHLKGDLNAEWLTLTQTPPAVPESATIDDSALNGLKPAAKKQPKGWDTTAYSFGALTQANADLNITVGSIRLNDSVINDVKASTNVQNGKAVVNVHNAALYGGTGKGSLTIDSATPMPTLSKQVTLSGVNMGNLLRDFYNMDNVEGTGNLELSTTAQGRSEREMIETLQGSGSVLLRDGDIKGVDILRLVQNAQPQPKPVEGEEAPAPEHTQVANLTGTFTIDKGIVYNDDLLMEGPLTTLTGKGEINLPREILKYRLKPKLDLALEHTAISLQVPVVVKGSIYDPQFSSDPKGLITEGVRARALGEDLPEGKIEKQIQKDLKGMGKNLFESLFGN